MLPYVPTVFEAGYPALEYEGLVGLFGLTSMSKDLIAKIGADVIAATKDSAVGNGLRATAQVINWGTTRIYGLHRRPTRANCQYC
jgi:tripartite-type tricarboxylate transporter receptor subunit TctC